MRKVILLNGASSAGKTTLARELQVVAKHPYLRLSVDDFLAMLPERHAVESVRDADRIPNISLVHGFHRTILSMANAGNCVVVDHVLGDKREWLRDFIETIRGISVVLVAVRCELPELLRRERARTDRTPVPDLAREQYDSIHSHMAYDYEIDTTSTPARLCAMKLENYLQCGEKASALDILRGRIQGQAGS